MSYGSMALLYPEVKPLNDEDDNKDPNTDPTDPTTKPDDGDASEDKILWGDADCNGEVDIADAVFIMQSLSNPEDYKLSAQGKLNADVVDNKESGITPADALAIQCLGINLLKHSDLPVKGDVLNNIG